MSETIEHKEVTLGPIVCPVYPTKYRWNTWDAAEGHRLCILAGQARKKPNPDTLHVYLCPHCDGYHVGHDRFPKSQEAVA